ncbi:hypothetical protein F2Q69_00016763 [Brassica cretica]|uniref:Uncharacterized protein n=1 Tax=Brassica cretica TaxID=69181 RepID=A0A8S9R8K3_BRACR|nr:hypothetical protein F2Q69_00016763 [Brassica cretica]
MILQLSVLPAFPVTLWRLLCYYEPVSLQLPVICFDFSGCDTRLPSTLLGVYPPPQQLSKTFSPLR